MKHRFEWNYNIENPLDYENFVIDMRYGAGWLYNYEQAARLFYEHDNGECVMIELQIPTLEMYRLTNEENINPWLDAYEVSNMNDYDASIEIYSEFDVDITFDNAEFEMLKFAKSLFEE